MVARRKIIQAAAVLPALSLIAACGSSENSARPLRVSAIPDQDPDVLTEREEAFAQYLATKLERDVEYVAVPDYSASVAQLGTGDLDLVFYGGLTGVQARKQSPDVTIIGQRDIDATFTSTFIANSDSGIEPVSNVAGLSVYAGKRFTFGSETSTSGRLMPSSFLAEAGVEESDLAGEPGFSGSHDKTIELVQAGTYEGGAVNSQVWKSRLEEGTIDTAKVIAVLESPTFHDYHWILREEAEKDFGDGFAQNLKDVLFAMHEDEAGKSVLELYKAASIIDAKPEDYARIEEAAEKLDLLG